VGKVEVHNGKQRAEIEGDCKTSAAPHSNLSLEFFYRTGHLLLNTTITSSTQDICGGTQNGSFGAIINISKLAVPVEDVQCKVVDATCANADFHV